MSAKKKTIKMTQLSKKKRTVCEFDFDHALGLLRAQSMKSGSSNWSIDEKGYVFKDNEISKV